ncbi:unnamed protein product, partial [Discosporangium mesarthrocarpum]
RGENAPRFQLSEGDVVGCGVDVSSGQVFFTLNGTLLGQRIKLPSNLLGDEAKARVDADDARAGEGKGAEAEVIAAKLVPLVSLEGRGNVIEANFGPWFLYDGHEVQPSATARTYRAAPSGDYSGDREMSGRKVAVEGSPIRSGDHSAVQKDGMDGGSNGGLNNGCDRSNVTSGNLGGNMGHVRGEGEGLTVLEAMALRAAAWALLRSLTVGSTTWLLASRERATDIVAEPEVAIPSPNNGWEQLLASSGCGAGLVGATLSIILDELQLCAKVISAASVTATGTNAAVPDGDGGDVAGRGQPRSQWSEGVGVCDSIAEDLCMELTLVELSSHRLLRFMLGLLSRPLLSKAVLSCRVVPRKGEWEAGRDYRAFGRI